jgi:hypothetical protein
VPDPGDVDVLIVGDGLAAWTAARDVARRGCLAVVMTGRDEDASHAPAMRHRPVGPWPSYVEAVRRLGREAARSLWDAFRENGDTVTRLAAELGLPDLVGRGGGFVLARTREEALDLAEGEDLLREDGFSGEFLDHYLLEARFDVRGLVAAYWAVDDLVLDEPALAQALRAESHETRRVTGPLLSLETAGRVVAETAFGRVRAGCLVLATEEPLGSLPRREGFRDERWSRSEHRIGSALALPCPARSWDGHLRWEQQGDGLCSLAVPAAAAAALDWAGADSPPVVLHADGVVAVSLDGLPVIGGRGGPVFLLSSGSGLDGACAVAGARWVVEAALGGRDEVPPLLRADRFG